MTDHLSRRDAIKKAAIAGGTLGVVWSAPKIEGLTLRPNYAAAMTGSTAVTVVWANSGDGGVLTPTAATAGGCWNTPAVVKTQSKDLTLEIPYDGTLAVNIVDQNVYDSINEGGAASTDGTYNFKANRQNGLTFPLTLMFDFTCT